MYLLLCLCCLLFSYVRRNMYSLCCMCYGNNYVRIIYLPLCIMSVIFVRTHRYEHIRRKKRNIIYRSSPPDFPFFHHSLDETKKKNQSAAFSKKTHTQTHRAIKFIFIRFFFYKKKVFQVTKEDFF